MLAPDHEVYKEAGEKYEIPWQVVSAIHSAETSGRRHTDSPVSPAGATGCTQFLPSTFYGNIRWTIEGKTYQYSFKEQATEELIQYHLKRIGVSNAKFYLGYGVDGDHDGVIDLKNCIDAIFSTANYLSQNYEKSKSFEKAVFRYNHANWYVNNVKKYAKELGFIF